LKGLKMLYLKCSGSEVLEFPLSMAALKSAHPNTSFPKKIPENGLPEFGVYPVSEEDAPSYDVRTQGIERQSPSLSGGSWSISWALVNKSQDEIDQYDQRIADKNRLKRNELLSQTDYYALTDVTMDAAMTSYRQALRDITTHANWPYLNDEDWPTKPE
jgi:hypothetical protein